MKILIGCEFSQIVTKEFRGRGHEAYSCDLLPTEGNPDWHIQGDIRNVLGNGWDLMIVHPDCTYLTSSGLHWNGRIEGRQKKTDEALDFVRLLLDAPIEKICLENPVGCISTKIRKPDQIIQPYNFGEDASKSTCLWLKNLDKLVPTKYITPRVVNGKNRWSNQTDSGQNVLTPSPNRWKDRSRTYVGIAKAMAKTWGMI
jgi:hypothetical protein